MRRTKALPEFKRPSPRRSRNMRNIRSIDNQTTERRIRALLIQARFRSWELHPSDVPYTPDLLFRTPRVAVFVDGCFWHCCPKCGRIPRTNVHYWSAKLERNRRRDARARRTLNRLGFAVVRIWECDLRTNAIRCVRRINRAVEARGDR